MLKIDEKIQALFQRDGVHKNFRVTFPDGEREDLTNENIIYESVNFTESLCSQDNFKFGLCEAGEISFEMVGIENIVDMRIKCFIEIDVSSLREWDSENKKWVNNYSGRYISDTEIDKTGSEVEDQVFSIPLGVFTVSSSPRSQSDMTHRQVTAYTVIFDEMLDFPSWLVSQLHKTPKPSTEEEDNSDTGIFTIYLPQFLEMNIERENWTNDYTSENVSPSSSGVVTPNSVKDTPWRDPRSSTSGWEAKIADGCYLYFNGYVTIGKGDTLKKVTGLDYKVPYLYTVGVLENNTIFDTYEHFRDYIRTQIGDDRELDEDMLEDFFNYYLYSFIVVYSNKVWKWVEHDGTTNVPILIYDEGLPSKGWIQAPANLRLVKDGVTKDLYGTFQRFKRYLLKANAGLAQMNLTVDSNLDAQTEETGPKTYRWSFYNAFSLKDIMAGYLEMHALFGNQIRNGKYIWFRMADSDPMEYDASYYDQFWWDEYDVDKIGYVMYTYVSPEGESEEVVYKLDIDLEEDETATSIYDMTSNKIIEMLEEPTKKSIQKLIDTYFVPHIDPIYFTPVDFSGIGLPYYEDGDFFIVETPDEEVIESYILKRTLKGIQNLRDSISSNSGSIISGEDYETPESDD